jgi:hypothetical protein
MRLPPTLLLAAALAAQGVTAASKAAPSPAITTPLICIPTGGHNLCTASGVVVVNEKRQFTVDVPDGTGSLSVRLTPSGGKGDADLEVVPPPESSAVRKTSREVRHRAEQLSLDKQDDAGAVSKKNARPTPLDLPQLTRPPPPLPPSLSLTSVLTVHRP